jgi:hypothetical protein
MAPIDAFFDVVAQMIVPELASRPDQNVARRHWIVIADAHGTELAEVDEDDPHDALRSFSDRRVDAAYVTYVPRPVERVLAYAITTDPANSDVRQGSVQRAEGSVQLGAWEYIF